MVAACCWSDARTRIADATPDLIFCRKVSVEIGGDDPQPRFQHADDHLVAALPEGLRLPCHHDRLEVSAMAEEFLDQAGLSRSGLATHGHGAAGTGQRNVQRLGQLGQFRFASDEATGGIPLQAMRMLSGGGDRLQLEKLHRLLEPLHWLKAERTDLHGIASQPPGLRADDDAARFRCLFHACGDADRQAHRLVVGGRVGHQVAHHHFAGMQPDTNADWAETIGGVALGVLQDGQGRVAGLLGVVLVRQRRAEDRHDAVAGDAVDRAAIAIDRPHHLADGGAQDFVDTLGVHPRGERNRSANVGEHDRHDFALPLGGKVRLTYHRTTFALQRRR